MTAKMPAAALLADLTDEARVRRDVDFSIVLRRALLPRCARPTAEARAGDRLCPARRPEWGNPGRPLADSPWVEPYPDELLGVGDGYAAPEARYEQREAVELAFITALQHLPPRQRAVLILREVLGFSATEVAESLGTTVASVNSALQRARKAVDERLPERSQQATLRSLGEERLREIVEQFVEAFDSGDVDAITAFLAEDVTFAMPPYEEWYLGRQAVTDSWLMPGGPPGRVRYVPTRANGQLALGAYASTRNGAAFYRSRSTCSRCGTVASRT